VKWLAMRSPFQTLESPKRPQTKKAQQRMLPGPLRDFDHRHGYAFAVTPEPLS
jgi:hypothetical protein